MFLESLLETSTQAKNRRGWATLGSFLIQVAAIGALILAPMLYTDALPSVAALVRDINTVSVPSAPAAEEQRPEPRAPQAKPEHPLTEFKDGVLQQPPSIPKNPYIPTEPEAAFPSGNNAGPCVGCVPGSTGPSGTQSAVLKNMLDQLPVAKPDAPRAPVPVSHVDEGMLIRRVQPVYPQTAIITHTQGAVTLRAIIGRDGVIRQLQVERGSPLLINAAVEAVRQWRYRPFSLNGQAVEVETEITVVFTLK